MLSTCLAVIAFGVVGDDDIYRDDFSDGTLARWEFFGGEWRAHHNVFTVEGGAGPRAMIKDVVVEDFEMQVDVRLGSPRGQAGVVFRVGSSADGVNGYHGYYVGIHAGANQMMWGASDGAWRAIARKPADVKPNVWQRIRLVVVGENVKCFINELPVAVGRYPKFDGVDSEHKKGRIGLRALGGSASFRNLVISETRPFQLTQSYTNPVQPACADPVVLRYEGVYYAYCTYSPDSPKMLRGIRMYSSPDLVNWKDHGFVLKQQDSWGTSRFWAPDIVEKDGMFFLYYAADTRICVATAKTPLGPFKQGKRQPMLPESVRIDAHVFQDDDGQYYFYYVKFNRGNEIWGGRLNDDMLSVDESSLRLMVKPDQNWERRKAPIAEGPEMIKHKGVYYLTYSGSHFESPDYAVGYATSDSPLGPWKKHDFNPIMKSTAYAHGTAHHCLTQSPDGTEMFIVYHRHHSLAETEPRQMAIDRIQFVPQENGPDLLEVWGPTSSPQPMPSGAN